MRVLYTYINSGWSDIHIYIYIYPKVFRQFIYNKCRHSELVVTTIIEVMWLSLYCTVMIFCVNN